jgi:hypothetical protein
VKWIPPLQQKTRVERSSRTKTNCVGGGSVKPEERSKVVRSLTYIDQSQNQQSFPVHRNA